MSAPFFFFFEKKNCPVLSVFVPRRLFHSTSRGGGHTRKRFKNHRRAEEGAKGQKKVEKTPKFVSRRKKKGKKKETRAQLPQKKEKKETHAPLIFLNERSFLLPVFGYFSQSSLSISPSISPAVLLPRGGEERERERERVKGREEEEDFVHTFF